MKTLIALNNERHVVTEVPEEFLLDMLLKKKNETGAYPTVEALMKDKEMPTQGSYAYYFKTYELACQEADSYEKRKNEIKPKAMVRAKYRGIFSSPSAVAQE